MSFSWIGIQNTYNAKDKEIHSAALLFPEMLSVRKEEFIYQVVEWIAVEWIAVELMAEIALGVGLVVEYKQCSLVVHLQMGLKKEKKKEFSCV